MTVRRRLDYDVLRVCSMVAVVYLHTAAGALRTPQNAPVWHFSNALTALFTTAVPLFFMLSGALLLKDNKTADLSTLFCRRLPKIVVPLLAWSAVVLVLTGLRTGWGAAWDKAFVFLQSPVLVPYWFLYALVPMYLVAPFLKKMADGLSPAHWRYLVGLWLVITLGVRTVRAFLPDSVEGALQLHWTLNIDFFGGYLGYFLLGAALERWRRPPSRRVLWAAAVVLYLIIALGTAWDTARTGAYDERFKSYLNLFAALLAAVIFLLARSYLEGRESRRAVTLLSGLSFGVYLIHPLVIEFWQDAWVELLGNPVDTVGEQILYYLLILLCCLIAAFVLSSIPGLCYLFTGQKFSAACRESNLFSLFQARKKGDAPAKEPH